MKAYSIGREAGCDIVINDTTDIISRRHATLNVESFGKMTIVDTSRNGTYVNGIRINPNVPFPVTRKDNVSFAHVARLDWSLVPRESSPLRYAIIGLVAIILVVCGVVGYNYLGGDEPLPPSTTVNATDSAQKAQDKENAIRKAVEDSIKHRQDSIKHREDSIKHRQDSIRDAKANKANKKNDKDNKKNSNTAKKDSTRQDRRLGN